MRDLAPCPRCRRLLRHRDATCPFCFAVRAVAFAAILPLSVACQKATNATQDAAPANTASSTATPTDTAAASASVVPPLPALSANLTPSAVASVKQAAIGRDGGADPALLAALSPDAGGLLALLGASPDAGGLTMSPGIGAYGGPPPGIGPGIGAYGAAPSPGLGALAAGNVGTSVSSTAVGIDARVVASRRPMLRACYTKGLASNPDMSGKLKLSVVVTASGAATATVASTSGTLSEDVKQCMTRSISVGVYEPSAHTFDVDINATNK